MIIDKYTFYPNTDEEILSSINKVITERLDSYIEMVFDVSCDILSYLIIDYRFHVIAISPQTCWSIIVADHFRVSWLSWLGGL